MLSETERRILGLYQAQVVIDSETTSAGNVGGMSIIDSTLIGAGANSFLTCAVIINPGDFTSFDVKPVAGFNNVTGEVTVSAAFKGGQVAISTRYMIVSIGGGGGAPPPPVAPSIGLWMFGVCDPGMTASATTLVCTNLAAFPDDIFNGEFWVQVIHNASVPGAAPEGEWRKISNYVGATGTFTVDAFSANVEENDLLAIVHESIVGIEILGTGTLTTDSATVPADTSRTEGDNYFNGCLLMTTEGAGRFQPRLIADYTGATGVFTLDAEHPFIAAPGLSDYVIIRFQGALVPSADGANNLTLMDVVGNKTDTPDYTPGATASSLVRLVKGMLGSRVIAEGTLDTSSATVPADSSRGEGNDFFNGSWLIPLTGAVAFQPRRIVDFTITTGVFTMDTDHPFTAATGLVAYIIVAADGGLIPGTDSVADQTVEQAVGAKADTPDYTYNATTSSLMRLLKGILGSRVIAEGTLDTSSATVPADSSRSEANDYFNGSLFMTVAGSRAFQPRRIVDYTGTGGIFILDLDHPLTGVSGAVAYIIIADDGGLVPGIDSIYQQTVEQAVGSKEDTPDYTAGVLTSSLMRLVKGILGSRVIAEGTFDTSSATVPADSARSEGNDYWNGCFLIPLTGAVAFQPRLIADFTVTTGVFTMDAEHPFTAATGLVDYIIVAAQGALVPAVDGTNNLTLMDIVGNKADTAITVADNVSSVIRYLKGIIAAVVQIYQEQIPDTDFALAAIDTTLTNPPPTADAENSIVDIDQVADSTFVLRSLWVNVTSFGTGATMTFQLWVLLNGVVTSVDSVIVNALGIQNLMDIFGLSEVHADGIWITAIVDVGNTGACSGTYNFAEAKK